ncbi:hypothetical protein AUK40_06395 [Candidatus Wirthbacteria bacterium CG2_30_54_11]|uniref:Heat-inducible transcription repressor HrcA n=1 Tax=Candidatus Wirthbacteria bacterium CG2_30_54_11 TaxID=1817892 RepID=A0A1J5ID18_9BACT|nr:MAG: hypothetical protein AUK40_06395 [Candidatus Wirthbacteria bacterium CG2_30_54_11]
MITPRTAALIRIIVDEYVSTGLPVASKQLVEKYDLHLSSATVRNIMAELVEMGFLGQPHTSAGRIPLAAAYRYYVESLVEDEVLQDEIMERIIRERETQAEEDYFREIVRRLAFFTSEAALLIFPGKVYFSGIANLLQYPEFSDSVKARKVIRLLEEPELLEHIISQVPPREQVVFVIGDENAFDDMHECSLALTQFQTPSQQGTLGVMGPMRMNYSRAFGILDHISHFSRY